MKPLFRDRLVALVTFLSGLYFVLEFLLPAKVGTYEFGKYSEQILQGVAVVGTMAFGLGIINIFMVHGMRLLKGQRGWGNSCALLTGLFVMFAVQILDFRNSQRDLALWKPFSDYAIFVERIQAEYLEPNAAAEQKARLLREAVATRAAEIDTVRLEAQLPEEERSRRLVQSYESGLAGTKASVEQLVNAYRGDGPEASDGEARKKAVETAARESAGSLRALAGTASEMIAMIDEGRRTKQAHRILYEGFFVPLGAAMFSLLAFYIANAAYRSFRIRSVEASVMMFAAIVVILGQIPQGPLYISEDLPAVRLWLLKNINTPGNRAIYFGAAIAGFAMAVRMWLSLEKNPLAEDDVSPPEPAKRGGLR